MAPTWMVRDRTLFLNGRPHLIYSGEIHYFRIPRATWTTRLAQAKALGLNTVGFYIPWRWHESARGRFDFTGRTHPQRDLIGFLRAIRRAGLHAFARVGPICHGELRHEGLPDWLLRQHPEIRLRQADGTIHAHPGLICYAHPTYRAFVERWYRALLPIIARHQIYPALSRQGGVNRSGPVILAQLDNEIHMLNWVLRTPDYSATATDLYRRFLTQRYRTVAALNHAYGSAYRTFEEIPQPIGHVDTEGWARCMEWVQFYQAYYAGYFAWLSQRAREEGLRVPLVANIPQCYDYNLCGRALPGLMTSLMFREFAAADPQILFGGAYQLRHVTFENLHDLVLMNEVCRLISSPAMPSICAELQTGVLHDRPRLYTSDVALTLALCFGGGLQGVNGYMLAGGANPPGVGARGRYHEWQAAIASDGRLRPHARAVEQAGRWVALGGETLAKSSVLYDDAAVGLYAPYYMTQHTTGSMPRRLEYLRDQLFFDGLARLLFLAGIRAPFVDLERATPAQLRRVPVLIVFALEFMSRDVQAKLLAYARGGGRLVLYPTVPTMNDHLHSERLLCEGVGIRRLQEIPGHLVRVGTHEVLSDIAQWAIHAPGARVIARTESKQPCAITKRVGRGTLMVLGFGLTHRFDDQVTVVRSLMQRMGLEANAAADPWDLPVLIRRNGATSFVFVCNPHEDRRTGVVRLRTNDTTTRIPGRGTLSLAPRSCQMLPVNLPLSRAIHLRWSSCEIQQLTRRPPLAMVLALGDGERASLELTMPRTVEVTVSPARVARKTRNGSRVWLELVGVGTHATLTFRDI